MRRLIGVVVGLLILAIALPAAAEVEIKSKAAEINITGRVQTQFVHSSVDSIPLGFQFFIRRARIALELKINDVVGGKVQPDYSAGKISLKDAYMTLKFGPNFKVYTGQFKRPFDLFELTSSTKILVIERGGGVFGAGVVSLSRLTELLGYSDRDVGVKGSFNNSSKNVMVDVAITNGIGSNKVPFNIDTSDALGEVQFTGHLKVKPAQDRDLTFGLGASGKPYLEDPEDRESDVAYAPAVQVEAEYGNFKEGSHVQAGFVWGENWREYMTGETERPDFSAFQVIGAHKHPLQGNKYIEAVEPLVRLGWADMNTDLDNDAGWLVTPGFQIFFAGRNKIAFNVDVWMPEDENLDTEFSFRAQTYLHY